MPSHQHPILGKIGQIEIIQPAFYDSLSVSPCLSYHGHECF